MFECIDLCLNGLLLIFELILQMLILTLALEMMIPFPTWFSVVVVVRTLFVYALYRRQVDQRSWSFANRFETLYRGSPRHFFDFLGHFQWNDHHCAHKPRTTSTSTATTTTTMTTVDISNSSTMSERDDRDDGVMTIGPSIVDSTNENGLRVRLVAKIDAMEKGQDRTPRRGPPPQDHGSMIDTY